MITAKARMSRLRTLVTQCKICPSRLLDRLHQLVADTPGGLNPHAAATELLAQPGHVHVNRAGVAEILVPPGLLQQSLAREHHAGSTSENGQELEFLGPQLQSTRANVHLATVQIHAKVGQTEYSGRRL